MRKIQYASLFSGGFGSANLAFKYMGIAIDDIFACELKKPQRESYILNHGEPKTFYRDILDLDGKKHCAAIDYLHASPPCTSFSMAGKREGLNCDTGNLMLETIRVINEVQPKMFTIENVSTLISSNEGRDWKEVLAQVRLMKNYTIQYGVMNAKDHGTPQNRKRIFIVGFRAKCAMMSFPQKEKLSMSVGDIVEQNVPSKYDISETMLKGFIKHGQRHTAKGNGFAFKPKDRDATHLASISTAAGNRPTDNFIKECVPLGNLYEGNPQAGRVYDINGVAPATSALGGGAGAKTGLFRIPHGGFRGGFTWTELCPSITTSAWTYNNFFLKKERIRRLTPLECSRAMGDFQDRFVHGNFSDSKLYEFVGNAICINTMIKLIMQMIKHSKGVDFIKPRVSILTKVEVIEEKGLFG